MTDETIAVEVHVLGRVQGVAFRYYTQQEAIRLGVRGHVRNERDGSVTLHAEGPRVAVEALVAWCRQGGPAGARVTDLGVAPTAPEDCVSFDIVR